MDITKVLEEHKKWLAGDGGQRPNLSGANLSGADLSWANLSWADLSRADLSWANLIWIMFCGATIDGVKLSDGALGGIDGACRLYNLTPAEEEIILRQRG